ncbi:hypothetical protein [Xanthomonas maliensis]|uniref:hypothetical protein n=1 Tax=Xanthomonas maliensis TaxID=1321368 RepID=UPI0003A56ADE|nr:hypothetical protein [Xanthomonas maliensis]KAB7771363.1 hypothetical protein CKY51_02975 [Xanthomonas maliensis]
MTRIDESTLQAYADGELDAAQAAQIEAAVAADPQLALALQRLRRLQTRLRAGFAPILEEPVPAPLLAAARARPQAPDAVTAAPSAAIPTTATASHIAPGKHARRRWLRPAALAAAVLLGLWVARHPAPPSPSAPVEFADTQGTAADSTLAYALEQALSGDEHAGIRMGLSFQDRSGAYCRTFTRDARLVGLACRRQAGWRVELQVPAESAPAPDDAVRMAASAMPAAVLQAVDARIAGEALDAAGERRARASGWR